MKKLSHGSGDDLAEIEFTYNHAGIRTKKVKKLGGVLQTTTEYILNGDKLVELIYTDHVNNTVDILHFYYDAQGKPAMVKHGSNMYAYVYNLQGDVLGLTDNTGALVADYRYDAWGSQGPEINDDVGHLNPFRYRGYIYDVETGLYYLKSRYYNSMICRFVCADSLISYNLFGYCGNNPILQIDANGTSYTRVSSSKEFTCEGRGGAGYAMVAGATVIIAIALLTTTTVNEINIAGHGDAVFADNTKTLSDVKAKSTDLKVYRLAFVSKYGELITVYNDMTMAEALAALGFTGATNALNQLFIYDVGRSSNAQRELEHKGIGQWGIYTHTQEYAKALAIVTGCNETPEVHDTSLYGHYHDAKHAFHIWYGSKITY